MKTPHRTCRNEEEEGETDRKIPRMVLNYHFMSTEDEQEPGAEYEG